MELSNKLRELRTRRGVTQEELAAAMGVSAQAVSKWERGMTMPDITLLPELSVFFGVSIDDLFGLTEEKEYDRIQNMLWDKMILTSQEIEQAERWLDAKIAADYRRADCCRLKADMYNHQAHMLRRKAEAAAKAALEADPDCDGALGELNDAMNGYISDWYVREHSALIDYLAGFSKKHPKNWLAMLWLMDNLMDDYRFGEAEEVLRRFEKIDSTFRTPLYRALLSWRRGDREKAHAELDAMLSAFPDEWMAYMSRAEIALMECDFDSAANYTKLAAEKQPKPRYVDTYETLALLYERIGDKNAAIAVLEEELAVLASDWDTTEGETADVVRRHIARLK